MKLVHTSDTQIKNWPHGGVDPETGLNRRFQDALKCIDFVIDHAIKIGAKYFVHAGDVNEERDPNSIAIEEFAKRVKRITDAGMEFIVIAGNHDVDSSIGCATSISYLKALGVPHVHIADKDTEVFEFDVVGPPIRFLCLPYFYKSQLGFKKHEDVTEYLIDKVIKFHEEYNDEEFINVCVSHYTVDKVFEGLDINEPVIPLEVFEDFDYNAFGHIHQYMDFTGDGVVGGYCGSPYRCSFGEHGDKYFNVVDFDAGTFEKIFIPNREFVDIVLDARNADQRGIEHFVVNKLKHMDLDNKFFKLIIQCYDKFNLKPIYDHLREREIFHVQSITFDREKVKSESRLEYEPSMSSVDVVKSYLKKQGLDDGFKKGVLDESSSAIRAVGI